MNLDKAEMFTGPQIDKYYDRFPGETNRDILSLDEQATRKFVRKNISVQSGGIVFLNANAELSRADSPVAVEQDGNGWTSFCGRVDLSAGTGGDLFRLPKGFRPPYIQIFRAAFTGHNATNEDVLFVQVDPDGDVSVDATVSGTGTVWLDNVSFFARIEV